MMEAVGRVYEIHLRKPLVAEGASGLGGLLTDPIGQAITITAVAVLGGGVAGALILAKHRVIGAAIGAVLGWVLLDLWGRHQYQQDQQQAPQFGS